MGKRISEEMKEEIKALYEEHKSTHKVAELLNISQYSVLRYANVEPRKKLTKEERKKRKSESVIEWRKKAKIKLVEYKGGECERCGYNKCIDALEFHHKDPNEKDFGISGLSLAFDTLKKEVDKCILVCSNCHKEIHFEIKNNR